MPPLEREGIRDDPIEQFADWFEHAGGEVPLAEAMTLATVDADGSPDARMVLLKGVGPDGFRFFTNYESAKGEQLAANPRAALVVGEEPKAVRTESLEQNHAGVGRAVCVDRSQGHGLRQWNLAPGDRKSVV